MKMFEKNIILASGSTLDSRFVQSLALIAGTRRVSPLVQNKPEDVRADTRCIVYRAKAKTKTIMTYMKALH